MNRGWDERWEYRYHPRLLEKLADNYCNYFEDITFNNVSSKIDFDMALDAIGKGHWTGKLDEIVKFGQFRGFGRMQQVVIADIVGIKDWELERLGFYNIDWLRRSAYRKMADHLNGKRN